MQDEFQHTFAPSTWTGEDRRGPRVQEQKSGIKFDATINLGHVLTFVGFIVAGFGAWSNLDKRVVVQEEGRKAQVLIDASQDTRITDAVSLLRQQLEKIDGKLDRLIEKRGAKE